MSHADTLTAAEHRAATGVFARWRALVSAATSTDLLVGVALAILWALGHGFNGIEGDARIYMGRALADVDPDGVGRDMMFAMDGQSAFTVFRVIARMLVAGVGIGPTSLILTLANLAAWFVAMAVFVRALVPGRAAALVLATVFVLPRLYAPWNLLAAGEALPVPRPLAEAGVLLALAALCHGRLALCAAGLMGAALFHPIMAAPGFGILFSVLVLRDWRWLMVAVLAGAAFVVGGALGLPIASRLLTTIDPIWRAILDDRIAYIFPSRWPLDAIGPPIVRIVTILIALTWLDCRARVVFAASIGIGLLGVAISVVFGDRMSDLLIIQAQPWRALWLMAVLAPVAAGICLWRLPSRGPWGCIAVALLALAWLALDWYPVGPLAAVVALAVTRVAPQRTADRATVAIVYIACAIAAAFVEWSPISALLDIVAKLPPQVPVAWTMIWSLRLPTLPVMALVLLWWRWPDAAATRAGAAIVVAIGLLLVAIRWDCRTPAQADEDAGNRKPDLTAMLASRPGVALWTDSDDIWYWLGAPNWDGATQGGSIVFSRALAVQWYERTQRMVHYGLAGGSLLRPQAVAASLGAVHLGRDELIGFCTAPDAPAWIVAALETGGEPPTGLGIRIWSPPLAHWKLYVGADTIRWRHLDRYAVIPCASGLKSAASFAHAGQDPTAP